MRISIKNCTFITAWQMLVSKVLKRVCPNRNGWRDWISPFENCGWHAHTHTNKQKMADTNSNKKANKWWTLLSYMHDGVSSTTEHTHFTNVSVNITCVVQSMNESFLCNKYWKPKTESETRLMSRPAVRSFYKDVKNDRG